MSKVFHMNGLQAYKMIIYHLIFLLAPLNSVWAGIMIYDGDLGIEEFRDVELSNTEPISKDGIMGAIVAASPIDACVNISKPPDVNISMNWFILIDGTSCSFEVKVLNARYAGYAAAVIYVSETRIPHFIRSQSGYYSFFPNISAVVIGSDQGHRINDNYLFSIDKRFRVYIFPNNSFSIMTFLLLFSIVTGLFLVVMLVFAVIRFFQHSSSSQRGRLTSRHLKQLQTSTYNKDDGSDSCAICLEEYKDQDKLRFLPCSHGYHARCIDPWLTNNRPICPVCKQKVVLEGHNSDNGRDSDLEERSETTPLLQERRETQYGLFNLIYNSAGENVGDLNLPSTSVSENIGHTRILRQSVSSPGGVDSSNNSATENLSGKKKSIDSAPTNTGVIKRLVFLKKSSPENLGSFNVSSLTSSSTGLSADLDAANLTVTDLSGDSLINITEADLSNNSVGGISLSSNPDDVIVSNIVPENFSERNQSSDSAVANIGGTNLPSDTITGYVAGMKLSEFWPSDILIKSLDKISSSKDSLCKNQDDLNLSSDVSVNLGGINLPSDANVNVGGGNVSSKSAAIGDITLPNESMSANLDGISLSGESSVVANVGDITVSTDSDAANIGGIAVPSDSIAANLGGVKVLSDLNRTDLRGRIATTDFATAPNESTNSVAANIGGVNLSSDLNRTDLSGIVEAIDSATANFEANTSISPVATNLGVRVSKKVVPKNLGINLPSKSLTANLEGSNIFSVSVSENPGGVNISSPSISANLGGVNISSPTISTNLGGVNTSSPPIRANLGGVHVSSPLGAAIQSGISISNPSVGSNLRGINVSSSAVAASHGGMTVSSPSVAASHGGMTVSSPSVAASLGDINVSSTVGPTNLGISLSSPSVDSNIRSINVSSPVVVASHGGMAVSSPSVATSLRGINVSSAVAPTNLDVNLSSASATASLSDASLSNKPVADNRRRRRKFK